MKLIIALIIAIFAVVPARAYPPDYPGVLQYGIPTVTSGAAEAAHVYCAVKCSVWSLAVTSGATAGYVLTFNAIVKPADGAVTPINCAPLPANSTITIDYGAGPAGYFDTGYTVVFSTTGCFTKTESATATFSARVTL